MRSDHIPNHDRRLHMRRCPECGEMYAGTDGHECADLDEIWDDYDPEAAERGGFDESWRD